MKIGPLEWGILAAVVIIAILLYVNRDCTVCKNRLASVQGVLPGAGTGAQVRATDAATAE